MPAAAAKLTPPPNFMGEAVVVFTFEIVIFSDESAATAVLRADWMSAELFPLMAVVAADASALVRPLTV